MQRKSGRKIFAMHLHSVADYRFDFLPRNARRNLMRFVIEVWGLIQHFLLGDWWVSIVERRCIVACLLWFWNCNWACNEEEDYKIFLVVMWLGRRLVYHRGLQIEGWELNRNFTQHQNAIKAEASLICHTSNFRHNSLRTQQVPLRGTNNVDCKQVKSAHTLLSAKGLHNQPFRQRRLPAAFSATRNLCWVIAAGTVEWCLRSNKFPWAA